MSPLRPPSPSHESTGRDSPESLPDASGAGSAGNLTEDVSVAGLFLSFLRC